MALSIPIVKINVKNIKVLNNVKIEVDSKTGRKVLRLNGGNIVAPDKEYLFSLISNKDLSENCCDKPTNCMKLVKSNLTSEEVDKMPRSTDNLLTSQKVIVPIHEENIYQKVTKDCETQTEKDAINLSDSQTFDLMSFILDGEDTHNSNIKRTLINGNKLKPKPETKKKAFFSDCQTALTFDISGNLPIHAAVMANKFKLVKQKCLILNALRENVNILNKQNYSPLHLAVLHAVDIEILNYLILQGGDISLTDTDGNTVIHLAVEHKKHKHLSVLLSIAAQMGFNLDVFNFEGFTPLILACLAESFDDVHILLKYGANANVGDMKSGRTALFHAVEHSNADIAKLLLDFHAQTNIRNFFGTSIRDAVFEIDEVSTKIKSLILGQEFVPLQKRKEIENTSHKQKRMKRGKK